MVLLLSLLVPGEEIRFLPLPSGILTLPAGEDMQQVQALLLRMQPVHQQEHYWEFVRNAEFQALPQIC